MDFQQLGIIILCLICMGAALGFERSLLPRMAVEVWDIHSSTTVLNFVSTFGASKAFANIVAGPLADRFGRKPTLVLGFLMGLPVMPFVNFAESWSGIIGMNVLFGVSQGLLGTAIDIVLLTVYYSIVGLVLFFFFFLKCQYFPHIEFFRLGLVFLVD